MCVYRSTEKDMNFHLGTKKKTSTSTMSPWTTLRVFKECGTIITIWTILTLAIQGARGAPLVGGGSGNLQLDKVDDVGNKVTAKSSSFAGGFITSLSMIVVSELGDKTFFIGNSTELYFFKCITMLENRIWNVCAAAVMAMRHSRLVVFSGAITALGFMTVFSGRFLSTKNCWRFTQHQKSCFWF